MLGDPLGLISERYRKLTSRFSEPRRTRNRGNATGCGQGVQWRNCEEFSRETLGRRTPGTPPLQKIGKGDLREGTQLDPALTGTLLYGGSGPAARAHGYGSFHEHSQSTPSAPKETKGRRAAREKTGVRGRIGRESRFDLFLANQRLAAEYANPDGLTWFEQFATRYFGWMSDGYGNDLAQFVTGFGDGVSFGLPKLFRDEQNVRSDSLVYRGGSIAGKVHLTAIGGLATVEAATAARVGITVPRHTLIKDFVVRWGFGPFRGASQGKWHIHLGLGSKNLMMHHLPQQIRQWFYHAKGKLGL